MKWCEHCANHYEEDHYDSRGQHWVGDKFGTFGYLLEIERESYRFIVQGDQVSRERLEKIFEDNKESRRGLN